MSQLSDELLHANTSAAQPLDVKTGRLIAVSGATIESTAP